MLELSLVAASRGYSSLRFMGFLLPWLLLLLSTGSRARGLQQLWHAMFHYPWNLPGPRTEPVSPALVGGFFFFFNLFILIGG